MTNADQGPAEVVERPTLDEFFLTAGGDRAFHVYKYSDSEDVILGYLSPCGWTSVAEMLRFAEWIQDTFGSRNASDAELDRATEQDAEKGESFE
jgi:hypothetical protein